MAPSNSIGRNAILEAIVITLKDLAEQGIHNVTTGNVLDEIISKAHENVDVDSKKHRDYYTTLLKLKEQMAEEGKANMTFIDLMRDNDLRRNNR